MVYHWLAFAGKISLKFGHTGKVGPRTWDSEVGPRTQDPISGTQDLRPQYDQVGPRTPEVGH